MYVRLSVKYVTVLSQIYCHYVKCVFIMNCLVLECEIKY